MNDSYSLLGMFNALNTNSLMLQECKDDKERIAFFYHQSLRMLFTMIGVFVLIGVSAFIKYCISMYL